MLFKYLPKERVDVLENLKIRFSPLRSLNDPFESLPLIDIEDKVETAVEDLLKELDQIWERTPISERTPENKQLLEENRQAVYDGARSAMEPSVVGQGLMDIISDNLGVLSLSRSNTSLLMWSHYTGSSTGYVIAFDESHDFFRQHDLKGNIVRPRPVIYTEKRSYVSEKHHNWYQKLLCEKPLEWAYEEEERLFLTHIDKNSSIGKDEYEMDIILTSFPKEAISSVYLGYNCSPDTQKKIEAALDSNNIDKPVYRAAMSKREYKIEFEAVQST
ncbi:DUF2971 domain-containing protein [Microbulbifer sp. ANSA005]|uniref:DUF2971 domain-containing protein n=1 Tax=Microbulbifer sp. ANSA005 TaxID=3243362 RepID=UPI004042D7B0